MREDEDSERRGGGYDERRRGKEQLRKGEMDEKNSLFHFLIIGSVVLTLEQSQHSERESGLGQEKRVLKVEIKEMELAHQETVKALKKVSEIIK